MLVNADRVTRRAHGEGRNPPWEGTIGKHDAFIIVCNVLDTTHEKEAIKKSVFERFWNAPSEGPRGIVQDEYKTVVFEECCEKCHDGVCETCNVGRVLKRLEGDA